MRLVAVHGYPLDRRLFAPLTDAAAKAALGRVTAVFAPDLRGRGTSKRPAAEIHTMSLLADDLAEDIGTAVPRDEPFLLAGLSMGGYVILEFLRRHGARFRGRIAGLALLDTKATADDEAGRAKRREAIEAIRKDGISAALSAILPKLLARGSKGGPAEETARAMILATPPETAMADLAGMAVRGESFDVLGSFGGPILIAIGEEDAITPATDAEAMAEAATRASYVRLLTIPGAGHLTPLEAPEDVAEAIAELSARATSPSPR
jgi:pimeloyl-ACP methyl ester carboxylesterase